VESVSAVNLGFVPFNDLDDGVDVSVGRGAGGFRWRFWLPKND
jgi:hypothetical protein